MVHRNGEYKTLHNSYQKKLKVKHGFHHGVFFKPPKFDSSQENEKVEGYSYDPMEEGSPIGLKLKKSPSFLELIQLQIQMKLAQETSGSGIGCLAKTLPTKEKTNGGVDNKLKASNFPATLLTIGTWEYKSRYEGDLVAKCYFAKHKLVWEVLYGGLKNKIEIQWSDIMAIKANYPDDHSETLDIVLSRPPLFFREINPQPRKHTLWQATTDFTCGQASLHRRHFLKLSPGTLGKHFPKLIQSDPRLSFLSKQPKIELDNPYFEQKASIFSDPNYGAQAFDLKTGGRFSLSGLKNAVSVSMSELSSSGIENQNPFGPHLKLSQSNCQSVPEACVNEAEVSSKFNESHGLDLLNQIKLPGLHPSMSVGDLVNHIGDCISEKMRSDNPINSINKVQKCEILDEITQYLLDDDQTLTSPDEKTIMSRVNSLCCLLQKEDTRVHNQVSSWNVQDLAAGKTPFKIWVPPISRVKIRQCRLFLEWGTRLI